jgi:23S rRNA pseudouridine2604 synthase
MTEPVRLAKRLAEMLACSRREAEQYIENGFVTVNGQVVEEPQARVSGETIVLSADATLLAPASVTLLLHKPAGFESGLGGLPGSEPRPALQLLTPQGRFEDDRSGIQPLKKHFSNLTLAAPLAPAASGLVVFTQDWRVVRKLTEDASVMEHEVIVDVTGTVKPGGLERLNRVDHGLTFNGVLLPPAKVSWQNENRLRFAVKGERAGQLAWMCEAVGLQVQGMKRIRVGRVPMSNLPVGQWRYLLPHEKF